jgi:ubiquinone/menaquinone biosynthesis C-methylase UbiE
MMSLVHEALYGLLRNPYEALRAAGLGPGQEVLEVGCGPGFFTIPAAKIVGESGHVVALDVSALAIQAVERKIQGEAVANVEILLADAANTGLPDERFDVIFVFGFAHSKGDRDRIFQELHRLLKPQGVLSTEGELWRASSLFELSRQEGGILQFRKVG